MLPDMPDALQPIDFSTHVLSLASSAMVALGRRPAPDGQVHPLDLETAHHLIEVIVMLDTKTRGNLETTEGKLLASLLHDLRIAFVTAEKASK